MFINNPHPALAEFAPNGQAKVDFLAWFNDGFVITDNHVIGGRPDIVRVRLLPEASTQRVINPRGMILHTQAAPTKSPNINVWNLCASEAWKTEPHIIGPEMQGGLCIQSLPFNIRGDSNYLGNEWEFDARWWGYLSCETQDNGASSLNQTPWTLEQLNVLAGISTATAATYGFACTDTTYYRGSGIAPHNRWPQWSKTRHSCPGKARTAQMDWIRGEVAKRLANYYTEVGMQCPINT